MPPAWAWTDAALFQLFEAVYDQSPTGLLVFDPQLRYVRVNAQMAAMANTPADQLLGRSFRDAFPDYGSLTALFERVLETGEPLLGLDVSGEVRGDGRGAHVWSLSAYRLSAPDGTVLGLAVTSTDMTAVRETERERASLAARLEMLAAAGELLSGSLDERTTVDGVLRLVVPAVARWACIHLQDEDGGAIRLAGLLHGDPAAEPLLDRVLGAFQVTADQPLGAGHVIATGVAEDLPTVTEEMLATLAGGDGPALEGFLSLAVVHGVVVPLTARGTTFGALSLSLPEDTPPAPESDVVQVAEAILARQDLVADIAARAALALDNARLYARQREVAVTLQRSLLPASLPQPPGLDVAAQYLPGAAGTEVGGDFYEAVVRSDGRLVLAIGDVMGRGLAAAAVMGQVRAALRAYALEGHDPAGVLARLNVMVSAVEDRNEAALVTCLVAVLDVHSGDLDIASAGHLPPVRADGDGACSLLTLDPDPPLGVPHDDYRSSRYRLEAGETLLLCTDGLVEGPELSVGDGLSALCRVMEATLLGSGSGSGSGSGAGAVTAAQVCAAAVDEMGRTGRTADDIAVLVVRRNDQR